MQCVLNPFQRIGTLMTIRLGFKQFVQTFGTVSSRIMAGSPEDFVIKLPSGGLMPMIGFGTFQVRTDVEEVIEKAIGAGYRHIDTAYSYFNETEIGNALSKILQNGTIKREDLFIVTKLPGHAHHRSKVPEVLKGCLQRLQLDYVDLFVIHSPLSALEKKAEEPRLLVDKEADLVEAWKGMEDVYRQGLTKSIGLSNFNSKQISRILENCTVKPENLQVECHAYFQQRKLYDLCQQHGITFTAYSPIGRPGLINRGEIVEEVLMEDEDVKAVARKLGRTPVQILLRFLLQLGMTVIPKSANEGRMKENIQLFDFSLSEEDMAKLKSLDRGLRYVRFEGPPWPADHPQYPFKEPF